MPGEGCWRTMSLVLLRGAYQPAFAPTKLKGY